MFDITEGSKTGSVEEPKSLTYRGSSGMLTGPMTSFRYFCAGSVLQDRAGVEYIAFEIDLKR